MKKYILPGVAVIVCGAMIYQTYTIKTTKDEMQLIEQQMMELKSINESLQQSINGINDNVQTTLNEELGKSRLTKNVKFKLNNNVKDGYDLNVRVELKELKGNSKVIFMYKEESSNEWKQLDLEEIADLSYSSDFILPYDKTYEYKIILKGANTESGDVELLVRNEFMPEFPHCSWSEGDEGISFYISANDYEGQVRENKIKQVDVLVSRDKKEKIYKAEYKEDKIYEDGNTTPVDYDKRFELEIPKKDNEGKLDYIKVKLTYENGITDIVDITDQQMIN